MSIKVYTDGACKGNPGRGGWGVLIIDGQSRKEFYGGKPNSTNNIMEMQAAIEALKHLKGTTECIVLHTDSNYLKQGITDWINKWKINGWKNASKKPVANKDLWIELDVLCSKMNMKWKWVKAHDGNPGNERADYLANLGADCVS